MDGLNDLAGLRVFERVVTLGSLTAAASELGLSLAAASKRLANFEKRLGVQLIHRSTRKLSVSDEGRVLYQHARNVLAELDAAQQALLEKREQVSGSVRITTPHSFGQRLLLPILKDFCQQYPQIRLELRFSDRVEDLISEGIDIAIRYGMLPDSRLVARKLLSNNRVVCASKAYIAQYGAPQSIADLAQHRCIVIGEHNETEWRFRGGNVHIRAHIVCNDGEACHSMALAGMGIILKSYWDVARDVQQGRLVQLLPEQAQSPSSISLVYLRNQHLAPRIRVLIDFLSRSIQTLEQGDKL